MFIIPIDIGLGLQGNALTSNGSAGPPYPAWQFPVGVGSQSLGISNDFIIDLGLYVGLGANIVLSAVDGPGSTYATGSITLPSSFSFSGNDNWPVDTGEYIIRVFSDSEITDLSVVAGTATSFAIGTSVPTTIAAGGSFSFYYGFGSSWYRMA